MKRCFTLSKWFVAVSLVLTVFLLLSVSQVGQGGSSEGFVIGLSNGFINNTWRTQMISDFEQIAEQYKQEGLIKKYIVQSAGLDINRQISDIRNMIASGVDAILINPNSATALNPVIEEAHERGILVISFDQRVTSEYALNVTIDQGEWFAIQAQWLVDKLGGKGDIIVMNGVAGNPANETRWKAAKAVLDKYPDIHILTVANGGWSEQESQKVMSNLLAAYPHIDGILTQDGMAIGIVNAFQAAGRELPVMNGDDIVGFLRIWAGLKKSKGFETFAVANPPGISVSALKIALRLLQGEQLKPDKVVDHTIYMPLPLKVTNDNLDEVLEEYKDKPDSYFLDGWPSDEEIEAYFEH